MFYEYYIKLLKKSKELFFSPLLKPRKITEGTKMTDLVKITDSGFLFRKENHKD